MRRAPRRIPGLVAVMVLEVALGGCGAPPPGASGPGIESTGTPVSDPASSRPAEAGQETGTGARARYGRLPLRFEANRGQLDERVKFLARQGGLTVFLTEDGAVMSLRAGDALKALRTRLGQATHRTQLS